jgi:hypothetical protein
MRCRRRVHALAGVDAINLEPFGCPSIFHHPIQQRPSRPGIVHIGWGHQYAQHKAKRAGQDMALDPSDLFVAIDATLALLWP